MDAPQQEPAESLRKQAAQVNRTRGGPSVMQAGKPRWIWGTLTAILLLACAVAVFSMWVIFHYHPN